VIGKVRKRRGQVWTLDQAYAMIVARTKAEKDEMKKIFLLKNLSFDEVLIRDLYSESDVYKNLLGRGLV